jgi:hypothetical protein
MGMFAVVPLQSGNATPQLIFRPEVPPSSSFAAPADFQD